MRFVIIRDPLWNNIRVDRFTMQLLDTAVVQRLRYVRQLGLAYLVYPGATHTRFEHALGTYHLTRRTLTLLQEREESPLDANDAADRAGRGPAPRRRSLPVLPCARGNRRAQPRRPGRPTGHRRGSRRFAGGRAGVDRARRVSDLICGSRTSALQGLISGSLDLDKIDYLKRDALMCGVPYGEIDVDRLTNSLVLLPDPASGDRTIGVVEKGLAALESLLFAKYQMYRNVYWHHAVRSATAMYKRLVGDALTAGAIQADCHCRLYR